MFRMQLKITAYSILFTCLVYPSSGKSLPPKGCYQCQEEVWEEVVCDSLATNTSTVAPKLSRTTATTSTAPPPTRPTTKQAIPATTVSPLTRPPTTTGAPTDPYKKCYCECKLECKEFCRKVAESPLQKQIVQVSKITEPVSEGHIKSTQILQRQFVPKADEPYNSDNDDYTLSDTDENALKDYSMPQSYPLPVESSCEEEPDVEPELSGIPYHRNTNISPKSYFAKPVVPLIEPVYGPYAITEANVNKNIQAFDPYMDKAQQPKQQGAPDSNAEYGSPIAFENVYSQAAKSLIDPEHGIPVSIEDNMGKLRKQRVMSYDPLAPVINSPLESHTPFAQYDDSFDSILRNVIRNDPSYEAPHYS